MGSLICSFPLNYGLRLKESKGERDSMKAGLVNRGQEVVGWIEM